MNGCGLVLAWDGWGALSLKVFKYGWIGRERPAFGMGWVESLSYKVFKWVELDGCSLYGMGWEPSFPK